MEIDVRKLLSESDALATIAKKFGIDFLILFGSQAERPTPLSDVDIAVHLSTDIPRSKYLDLYLAILADIVTLAGRDDVDLVLLNNAPIDLAFEVFRSGRLLYCADRSAYVKEMERALSLYLDLRQPLHEHYMATGRYFAGGAPSGVPQARISRARVALGRLQEVAQKTYEEYAGSVVVMDATERNLNVAIQAILDIGNHIIAERGLGRPGTYADVIRILCGGSVLPKEWEDDLVKLAGLRNILVHGYATIDHQLLHETLRQKLQLLKDTMGILIRILDG